MTDRPAVNIKNIKRTKIIEIHKMSCQLFYITSYAITMY